MPALPSDIAKYTSDGVLITLQDEAIKTADPNASNTGDNDIDMFFDDPADAQVVAEELFSFLSLVGRPHEAVEIEDSLGLGSTVPIFPLAPRASIRDDTRQIDTVAIIRAYSFDMDSDAYALELIGAQEIAVVGEGGTFDSTEITFDNDALTWDTDPDA